MDEATSVGTEGRIEMRELLRLSGISYSDLRNWVRRRLLPRPRVGYLMDVGGSQSYYPAETLERARKIKRLRSRGHSTQTIRDVLAMENAEL